MSYTKLVYSDELKDEYFKKTTKCFCSKYKVSTHTAYKIFWQKPKVVIKRTIKNLNDYLEMPVDEFATKHSIDEEQVMQAFGSHDDALRLLIEKNRKLDPYKNCHNEPTPRWHHEYYQEQFKWCTIIGQYWHISKCKEMWSSELPTP